jgi:hypothetical protein
MLTWRSRRPPTTWLEREAAPTCLSREASAVVLLPPPDMLLEPWGREEMNSGMALMGCSPCYPVHCTLM